ncbi:MAG: AMP-binding protein [Clostridiales Family XIII bacterium]|nr:AMP-binding protein [Clostridiales Family XIII bacterium]
MNPTKTIIRKIERPLAIKLLGWQARDAFEQCVRGMLYRDIDSNLAYQRERLRILLKGAIANVPYYRNIAREYGIDAGSMDPAASLSAFPVLTKEDIRMHSEALLSERPGQGIYKNSSGGSTGEPVVLFQDKQYLSESATHVFDEFSGYEYGEKMVLLWGSERDILHESGGMKYKLFDRFFYRQRVLNSFRMSNDDMGAFCALINRFKPPYMRAYVQSANELAKYAEERDIALHPMRGIIVSAGTLYDDFRERIERVFGCPVFNRYGSREVSLIAMECEAHQGLHQNIFTQYIEIVDADGKPTPPGEMGRILVTNLTNHTMPLIRFDIGDMAVPTDKVCSCGRGLPLIEKVVGRTVNVFKTAAGDLVDGEYFTHLFYGITEIEKFQVVQTALKEIEIKYVVNTFVPRKDMNPALDEIRRKVHAVMGPDCIVRFHALDDIPPSASGKYIYTISEI